MFDQVDTAVAQSTELPVAPAPNHHRYARGVDTATLARLLIIFASVAVVLAFVGIFGVMGHYVQQNSKEISVRVALGGTPARIGRLVAGHALLMVVGGALAGLPMAYAAATAGSSLLFSVGASQLSPYLLVLAFLFVVGGAACFVPIRRALSLPPAALLRD